MDVRNVSVAPDLSADGHPGLVVAARVAGRDGEAAAADDGMVVVDADNAEVAEAEAGNVVVTAEEAVAAVASTVRGRSDDGCKAALPQAKAATRRAAAERTEPGSRVAGVPKVAAAAVGATECRTSAASVLC